MKRRILNFSNRLNELEEYRDDSIAPVDAVLFILRFLFYLKYIGIVIIREGKN